MEGGLTEIVIGVTAGAYSPLAVIAAWQVLRRTIAGKMAAGRHHESA
jgi:hypothetical protein